MIKLKLWLIQWLAASLIFDASKKDNHRMADYLVMIWDNVDEIRRLRR